MYVFEYMPLHIHVDIHACAFVYIFIWIQICGAAKCPKNGALYFCHKFDLAQAFEDYGNTKWAMVRFVFVLVLNGRPLPEMVHPHRFVGVDMYCVRLLMAYLFFLPLILLDEAEEAMRWLGLRMT